MSQWSASCRERRRTSTRSARLNDVGAAVEAKIDLETCAHYGGAMNVLASIEDPVVIKQILEHVERRAESLPRVGLLARAHGSIRRYFA